ncbi:hypothetical protein B0H13DRAFT_2058193 [Mycena leptocephala]|nr:hypothetical protein B0H13DRAFT_2058193 [Mycena leptocephala]
MSSHVRSRSHIALSCTSIIISFIHLLNPLSSLLPTYIYPRIQKALENTHQNPKGQTAPSPRSAPRAGASWRARGRRG